MNQNELEAWKAVTEFSKTVLSLSATVLAVIVSYMTLHSTPLGLLTAISPALLVIAIVLALFGFGHAIKALKTGTPNKTALAGCNSGAISLLLSIVLLPFTLHTSTQTIDGILGIVESTTKSFAVPLSATNCKDISKTGNEYLIRYVSGGTTVEVVYSLSKAEIVSIK